MISALSSLISNDYSILVMFVTQAVPECKKCYLISWNIIQDMWLFYLNYLRYFYFSIFANAFLHLICSLMSAVSDCTVLISHGKSIFSNLIMFAVQGGSYISLQSFKKELNFKYCCDSGKYWCRINDTCLHAQYEGCSESFDQFF